MIFRIYHELYGGHVHCRLFAGPHDGALGKCGDIVMRKNEFDAFKDAATFIDFRQETERFACFKGLYPRLSPCEIAEDWFTLPPRERTKARLMQMLK